MNDVQARFKALAKRAKKVDRALIRNGNDFVIKIPISSDSLTQKYDSLDKVEEIILGLEEDQKLLLQNNENCEFQCFEIGGPWIAENPFCPIHGAQRK